MRSNAVLCLVLCGLVSYGYLERQAVPQDTAAPITAPVGEKLLVAPLDHVVALRFKDPRGCLVLNQSGRWRVTGSPETGIDTDAMTQLLSTIETAQVIRAFDCEPVKLAQYGLTTPSLVMGVRYGGEQEFHDLLVGDKNPVGNAVYAQWTYAPQVLLVGTYFETVVRMMVQRIREGQQEPLPPSGQCPDLPRARADRDPQ